MTLKSDVKFEEKLTCGLENDMRNLANFHQSTWKSQNWDFDGILLSNVENLQRNYVLRQWRMMQTLKRNWLDVSKLTPQFDKFWPEHLNASKICTLMGSFWPKYIMFELKKYRWVIFHDTQAWCKIWRKSDLWFGKWHEEFGKCSPEHLKVSKLRLWWDPFVQSRKCMS